MFVATRDRHYISLRRGFIASGALRLSKQPRAVPREIVIKVRLLRLRVFLFSALSTIFKFNRRPYYLRFLIAESALGDGVSRGPRASRKVNFERVSAARRFYVNLFKGRKGDEEEVAGSKGKTRRLLRELEKNGAKFSIPRVSSSCRD